MPVATPATSSNMKVPNVNRNPQKRRSRLIPVPSVYPSVSAKTPMPRPPERLLDPVADMPVRRLPVVRPPAGRNPYPADHVVARFDGQTEAVRMGERAHRPGPPAIRVVKYPSTALTMASPAWVRQFSDIICL